MSILPGIVIVAALLGAALAATVSFIVMSLSRSSQLIAARAGRGRIEAVLVCPGRPRRTVQSVDRRSAPLLAFSRDIVRYFSHGSGELRTSRGHRLR